MYHGSLLLNRFPLFEGLLDEAQPNQMLRCDVQESDENYLLSMDLPGISDEDLNISLEKGVLTIEVKKSEEKREEGKYVFRERRSFAGQRKFQLGDTVNEDEIEAKLEQGVLKLRLGKKESSAPKKISVSSN